MEDDDQKYYELIIKYVKEQTGFNIDQYRESYIKRRLAVRQRVTGTINFQQYLQKLKTDDHEPKKMVEDDFCGKRSTLLIAFHDFPHCAGTAFGLSWQSAFFTGNSVD